MGKAKRLIPLRSVDSDEPSGWAVMKGCLSYTCLRSLAVILSRWCLNVKSESRQNTFDEQSQFRHGILARRQNLRVADLDVRLRQ